MCRDYTGLYTVQRAWAPYGSYTAYSLKCMCVCAVTVCKQGTSCVYVSSASARSATYTGGNVYCPALSCSYMYGPQGC